MSEPASSEAAFLKVVAGQILRSRHKIIKKIREFFDTRGYLEVETPLLVRCPGIDPYIDAISCAGDFFLATSPELQMKRLLGPDIERIYQITHAFRADEEGPLHSPEFTMLEWYRTATDYLGIMDESEELIKSIVEDHEIETTPWQFPFDRLEVDALFKKSAGWQPSQDWDEERYFRDWVEIIDPYLNTRKGVFLMDFPIQAASLACPKKGNPRVCERFEIFMGGIEIGNAFTELTDFEEHVVRFENSRRKRMAMGKAAYPLDDGFMQSLKCGIPACGGIAVGLDRLMMAVLGLKNIDYVQTFPLSRL